MTYVLFFYFYTLNSSCFLNVFVVLLYYITTKMKDITYSEMKRATMREGGGYEERGKACESGRLQVVVAAEVQSSERHASACFGIPGINNYISAVGNKWSSAPVLYLFSISRCRSQILYLPTTNYYILKRNRYFNISISIISGICKFRYREHALGLVSVPLISRCPPLSTS